MSKKQIESLAVPEAQSQAVLKPSGEIGEALVAYRNLQRELDAQLPDCIVLIKGKKFRSRSYWRAVAAAFGLDVDVTTEELQKGDNDWGYIVTCRATAPNGRTATGDGACFASEKKDGGMRPTLHNVRAHAHTRAYNRSVSNLVGFGEVSADEVTANAKQVRRVVSNDTN